MPLATSLDMSPSPIPGNPRSHDTFTQLIDTKCFALSYSDQTGRFLVQSSRGNNYIFVRYDYDSNTILSVALPDRRGSSRKHSWMNIFNKLSANSNKPKLHILIMSVRLTLNDLFPKMMLTSNAFPHINTVATPRNVPSRQTWKHHFIAGFASTDQSFPLNDWDYLLPQCDITLNDLRSSRR